jgi:hypothetical protein
VLKETQAARLVTVERWRKFLLKLSPRLAPLTALASKIAQMGPDTHPEVQLRDRKFILEQ